MSLRLRDLQLKHPRFKFLSQDGWIALWKCPCFHWLGWWTQSGHRPFSEEMCCGMDPALPVGHTLCHKPVIWKRGICFHPARRTNAKPGKLRSSNVITSIKSWAQRIAWCWAILSWSAKHSLPEKGARRQGLTVEVTQSRVALHKRTPDELI